ncbi:MAG: hypothetical protein R3270_01800 [Gammaproteobacteria bacterium]|nr:hypothetical protein [Gammaproteobacteria bacterium]
MQDNRAHEDLATIRELMVETRQAAYHGGAYFIVWGLAIGLGLLATWLFVSGAVPMPASGRATMLVTWALAIGLGGLAMWWWPIRREQRAPVRSAGGRLIGLNWMAVGTSLMIVFFIGVGFGSLPGYLMNPVSALFIGIGIFMTGVLAGIGWIRNLAFGWWLGGAVMLAYPGLWNLWFMGLLLLLLYMLPGVLLARSKG